MKTLAQKQSQILSRQSPCKSRFSYICQGEVLSGLVAYVPSYDVSLSTTVEGGRVSLITFSKLLLQVSPAIFFFYQYLPLSVGWSVIHTFRFTHRQCLCTSWNSLIWRENLQKYFGPKAYPAIAYKLCELKNLCCRNLMLWCILLAPSGALIVMMVYYISAAAAAPTFSDFQHLCLSILLQVSL